MSLTVNSLRTPLLLLPLAIVAGGSALSSMLLPDEWKPRHYDIRPESLARPGATKSVLRLPKTTPIPAGTQFQMPPGFHMSVFAEGLSDPRWMTVAPNGDVFVVESRKHQITVLRDSKGDKRADKKWVYASKLYYPFGIQIRGGYVWAANTGSVIRWKYAAGDTTSPGPPENVITGIPENGYNQHWTRNILFSASGKKLYLTVGSKANLAEEDPPRACIMEYNPDGSGRRIVASGLRNPVGLAFEPKTNALWTTVNERDYEGDDLVPDYFTRVKEGGYYGWPYTYIGNNPDRRLKGKSSNRKAIMPDVLIQAHSAALGLVFYTANQFPNTYQGDAFIALHGSTNRAKRTGYKIIRVRFKNGKPIGGYDDFITGWMTDEDRKEVYGRPVGLAIWTDGSLLIADDAANKIWRISYGK